jgi:hypothetical protein
MFRRARMKPTRRPNIWKSTRGLRELPCRFSRWAAIEAAQRVSLVLYEDVALASHRNGLPEPVYLRRRDYLWYVLRAE